MLRKSILMLLLLFFPHDLFAEELSIEDLNEKLNSTKKVKISACHGSNLESYVEWERGFAILEIENEIILLEFPKNWIKGQIINVIFSTKPENKEDYGAIWRQMLNWHDGHKLPVIYGNLIDNYHVLNKKNLSSIRQEIEKYRCSVFGKSEIPEWPLEKNK